MKRRSFFGLVSGLMAGCMVPWRSGEAAHLYCRQLHTTDHSYGIPITSHKWQYRVTGYPQAPKDHVCFSNGCVYPSEWQDTRTDHISKLAVGWKGAITWSIERAEPYDADAYQEAVDRVCGKIRYK